MKFWNVNASAGSERNNEQHPHTATKRLKERRILSLKMYICCHNSHQGWARFTAMADLMQIFELKARIAQLSYLSIQKTRA